MKPSLHSNVYLLTLALCFAGCIGPMIVFVGGFVGMQLAPSASLSTLPISCMVIGTAMFMLPVVRLLQRVGRKCGILITLLFSTCNCLFAAYAIWLQHFWLFCLSLLLFGVPLAANQQYRFMAIESVSPNQAGIAVSTLLIAGLGAAFLGPELGLFARAWMTTEFVGSFIALAGCMLVAMGIVSQLNATETTTQINDSSPRPIITIMCQPVFILAVSSAAISFAIMSFIMTATPISMHLHHHYSLEQTKWVIQSHIVAMYLPSLFTGLLVRLFGLTKLMMIGLLVLIGCILLGFAGQQYLHYWFALVALGVGWNFMFVAGTSLLPQSYQENEKFRAQGANDFIVFSLQAGASLSAGWVLEIAGWQYLLLINVPFLLLPIAALIYYRSGQSSI